MTKIEQALSVIKLEKNKPNSMNLNQKGLPTQLNEKGHYHLPSEQVRLPCAAINMEAVAHNIRWMQAFADANQVLLAPHGKTSLTPAILSQQLAAGAWGITMATIEQAYVAYQCGAHNILLANQLVGKANWQLAAQLMRDPDVNLWVCVDSIENAQALSDFFASEGLQLNVLLEIGVMDGRCGVRQWQELAALAHHVHQSAGLSLQGIEFYEGVIHAPEEQEAQQVQAFLAQVMQWSTQLRQMGLFEVEQPIISGAGSAYYDLVTHSLKQLPDDFRKVIRPGCYVSHDKGIYQQAQQKIQTRLSAQQSLVVPFEQDLISAIEVWAYIIARPEPTKAIVNLGKRDVAFDTSLPQLERVYRNAQSLMIEAQTISTLAVMDQHLFLSLPAQSELQVGDMVVFSTSHPCITFDKWRYIAQVNHQDQVMAWMKTEF